MGLPEEGDFRGFEVKFWKVDFNTSEELPKTINTAVYQNSTALISGLAMGTDYKFEYKILSYSGNSEYSNPLQVITPINNSTMDDMRRQVQEEMHRMMDAFREEFDKTIVDDRTEYVHTELGKLREISLHGKSGTSGILYVNGYMTSASNSNNDEMTSMSNVDCNGSEPSIFECEHMMFKGCKINTVVHLECSDENSVTTTTTATTELPFTTSL